MNSFSYAGHESYKRHESHEEAVGSGRGNEVWAERLLNSARWAGQLQAAHTHPVWVAAQSPASLGRGKHKPLKGKK